MFQQKFPARIWPSHFFFKDQTKLGNVEVWYKYPPLPSNLRYFTVGLVVFVAERKGGSEVRSEEASYPAADSVYFVTCFQMCHAAAVGLTSYQDCFLPY